MAWHINIKLGAAVLFAMAAFAPHPASAEIGSVGAVNGKMQGTPPSRGARTLQLGDTIFANELIQTGADGIGQLLFVDKTSLTVGKNSRIILDRYVFDPDKDKGQIAVSMTKGALRFVGGAISKTETVTVRTPTGSIGIRGGMAMIEIQNCAVASNCNVLVTNIASQFVSFEQYGDNDGDGIDDGPGSGNPPLFRIALTRPGATATGNANGIIYTGIATPTALTSIFESMESSGRGGLGSAINREGINPVTTELGAFNSGRKGAISGIPVTTDGSTPGIFNAPLPSVTDLDNTGGVGIANGARDFRGVPPSVIDPFVQPEEEDEGSEFLCFACE